VAFPATEVLILRFGAFELDLRAGELRRGGVLVKLSPQQFRVLRFLAERGGQVCTREEIRREIWGEDIFVDFERGLNVCIAAIRSALNDDSEAPRFIQTVPRQGYRFVAPVEQVSSPRAAPAAPPSRTGRLRLAAGALLLLAAALGVGLLLPSHAMRLAVLPFEDLTQRVEDARLVEGLGDELVTQLGMLAPERLSVIGRTSVRRYSDGKASLAQMRRELGVDYVIEGTVRGEGSALRISVRLVKAPGGSQVWSEAFQAEEGERLELQGTVAAGVVNGVMAKLFPNSGPAARAYVPKAAAREAWWNGRYLAAKDRARAISWYQQAADLDAGWAEPRAALAEVYLGQALSGGPAAEFFPKARAAAEAALQLDERNAEAHNALAEVRFWFDWDWADARRHFQRALAINASMARAHHDYGFFQVVMGSPEAGVAELRRAIALDPLSAHVNIDAGWVLLQAHHYDEAIRKARRALELEPGMAEAQACIERALALQGKAPAPAASAGSAYARAMALGLARRNDEALAALEQAFAEHSILLVMLPTEPAFEGLRRDARFKALMKRVGF
jgi:DNA-binding winged helix-turn-helix (wHTH) protein/TolB-like protein/tetratricopeptide (TPR) repeat protein